VYQPAAASAKPYPVCGGAVDAIARSIAGRRKLNIPGVIGILVQVSQARVRSVR